MKNRYTTWVENLKWDWCISRQRYFGVPFPVWYCAECGKTYFAETDRLPVNPIETPYGGKCECGCDEFIPEKAVLDTWATSSLTPMINLDTVKGTDLSGRFMPMSMRTQAHEIIRTWAFYTIVKSRYHTRQIPWRDIMICGFVLAKPGEKISKSKGNATLTPQTLIDAYSADMIRYWAAGARLGTDTYFDQNEMREVSQRFITKLWNSSKFALSHLAGFDPSYTPQMKPIDRWMINRTKEAVKEAVRLLNNYEIGLARHVVDELFWKDLCDNYIEIVKERLYQPDIHGTEERKSAQLALYYCLLNVLKMYAIYVPHVAEYIYLKGFKNFVGAASVHLLTWEDDLEYSAEILRFGEELKAAVAGIRKYKSENNLSMKAETPSMTVVGSKEFESWFRESEKDLYACSHAGEIVYDLN